MRHISPVQAALTSEETEEDLLSVGLLLLCPGCISFYVLPFSPVVV